MGTRSSNWIQIDCSGAPAIVLLTILGRQRGAQRRDPSRNEVNCGEFWDRMAFSCFSPAFCWSPLSISFGSSRATRIHSSTRGLLRICKPSWVSGLDTSKCNVSRKGPAVSFPVKLRSGTSEKVKRKSNTRVLGGGEFVLEKESGSSPLWEFPRFGP